MLVCACLFDRVRSLHTLSCISHGQKLLPRAKSTLYNCVPRRCFSCLQLPSQLFAVFCSFYMRRTLQRRGRGGAGVTDFPRII